MYNEELKAKYISTFDKEELRVILRREFNLCEETEEKLDKDIKDFTSKEILNYYKSLKSYSLDSLMVRNYRFAHYADWFTSPDSINEFNDITTEMLKDCLDKNVVNTLILTREQVLSIIDGLPYYEAFLILAIFEGIGGKNYEEFYDITINDFENKGNEIVVHLNTNRELAVSKELYEYAKKSSLQYEYDRNDKTIYFDPGDRRIIKNKVNAGRKDDEEVDIEVDKRRSYRRLITTFMRLRDIIGIQGIKVTYLQDSGRIELIKKKMMENGDEDPKRYVNCDEAKYRYGLISSTPRWLLKYGEYF